MWASSRLKVISTVPELTWLVERIGGEVVETDTLNSGNVDLHFLEARVDYILKLRKADMLCYSGLGLEIGWLPKVVQRAGNEKILLGASGDCNLGESIDALNKPQGTISRNMGDVHPQGNPHYTNDPLMMVKAAEYFYQKILNLRPDKKVYFSKNLKELTKELKEISQKIKSLFNPIKNRKILTYHSEFNYWLKSYGFENMGMIEDKPGVPPSAGRLSEVATKSQKDHISIFLYTPFNSIGIINKFEKLSGVKGVELSAHAENSEKDAYLKWQMEMAKKVLDGYSIKL